jgi:hypothetical protein
MFRIKLVGPVDLPWKRIQNMVRQTMLLLEWAAPHTPSTQFKIERPQHADDYHELTATVTYRGREILMSDLADVVDTIMRQLFMRREEFSTGEITLIRVVGCRGEDLCITMCITIPK